MRFEPGASILLALEVTKLQVFQTLPERVVATYVPSLQHLAIC